jgi:membrane protein required for colicin V production
MLTQFDIVFCVAIFIFATLGLAKGAIKSILGLLKWYGAGVLTMMAYPYVNVLVAQYIKPGMIVNGVAIFFSYVAILILLSILISIFVAALGSTVGGGGDRILGAVVGASIAFILLSTIHYFIRSFSGSNDPDWLKSGKTYNITSQGADTLQKYFKDNAEKVGIDLGFISNFDISGSIANKVNSYQINAGGAGSQIDLVKLKEAIRMMKENGMSPEQIKGSINIQDYMQSPSETMQNSNPNTNPSGNPYSDSNIQKQLHSGQFGKMGGLNPSGKDELPSFQIKQNNTGTVKGTDDASKLLNNAIEQFKSIQNSVGGTPTQGNE